MTNKYYREEIKTGPRPKRKDPPRKIFKLVDEEGDSAPANIIERSRKNNIIYPIKKEEEDTRPRTKRARGGRADNMPARNKKNFRSTKSGAGMTRAGVAAYRRKNPGSKLKTAVTGKVKKGSAAAKRRKSYCARSAGQMKKFPKAAANPNSRLRQARRRWKC